MTIKKKTKLAISKTEECPCCGSEDFSSWTCRNTAGDTCVVTMCNRCSYEVSDTVKEKQEAEEHIQF